MCTGSIEDLWNALVPSWFLKFVSIANWYISHRSIWSLNNTFELLVNEKTGIWYEYHFVIFERSWEGWYIRKSPALLPPSTRSPWKRRDIFEVGCIFLPLLLWLLHDYSRQQPPFHIKVYFWFNLSISLKNCVTRFIISRLRFPNVIIIHLIPLVYVNIKFRSENK